MYFPNQDLLIKAYKCKGDNLFELNKFREAIKCYDKVLEMEPKHLKALSNKANALTHLDRFEASLPVLDKLIELLEKEKEDYEADLFMGVPSEAEMEEYIEKLEVTPIDQDIT